ncbi:PRC-barrel domain-containing protein [Actinacidiphila bryophytorum]|uniref:PRC-barrel domain-containing protein n=1 Tax=Actinacidiphila bryophytorum TaxID=1436133 RepID=A0A9W4H3I7_9ACTN|nr:PRC-barrel domain-containing protein [Actinacidiphila bryophytorum]MBM9438223.1 PRC-barrel domain-containing protein [Actinacidiphila bryophytorum]MBN6545410.1 PRC-barrel domain-containing protein [Actinacidiphila bryophytorum]CAG7647984.1 conserved hypothetical protein [Actinacidiphila bryophytorum]
MAHEAQEAREALADPEALRQLTAYDRHGERIGRVTDVYVEDLHRLPEWVSVLTEEHGPGSGATFVPLEGASAGREGVLEVACTAEAVRSAPRMEAEQHLDLVQEQQLYRHYGLATPAEEASGAPGVGEGRPKWPVTEGEADLQGFRELAEQPPVPRLRRYVPDEDG